MSAHAGFALRCRFAGLLLGLALAAMPAAAEEPGTSSFSWQAPAECPRRGEVLQQFSRVLGSAGTAQAESVLGDARVRGTVARRGEQWVLDLELDDGDGRRLRRLESEQCTDLAHAAALALALLLEQTARARATPENATPLASASTPESEEASLARGTTGSANTSASGGEAPSEAGEPEEPADTPGLAVGVQALLDTSTLARPALGASLALIGRLDGWSAVFYADWLPARRTPVAGSARDVEFEQWALGLRPCRSLGGRRWVLDACASGELGRVFARGVGLDRARDAANPWVAAGVGLGLRWNRSGGALEARTDVLMPLLRERYVVNEAQQVHETPPVTLRVALGIDLNL